MSPRRRYRRCPPNTFASEHLDEMTLAEGARSKSQAHLLAISTRKLIPESVTDILLERGNREVALSAAGNPGASFSEFEYCWLVWRSTSDDDLAACTWSRSEIPRRHLPKLFADASESVKGRISKEDPRKAARWPNSSRGRQSSANADQGNVGGVREGTRSGSVFQRRRQTGRNRAF